MLGKDWWNWRDLFLAPLQQPAKQDDISNVDKVTKEANDNMVLAKRLIQLQQRESQMELAACDA